jgi:hypothetical protein
MDTTFLPLAAYHGAEIRSECFVTEFEFDSKVKSKPSFIRKTARLNDNFAKMFFSARAESSRRACF